MVLVRNVALMPVDFCTTVFFLLKMLIMLNEIELIKNKIK